MQTVKMIEGIGFYYRSTKVDSGLPIGFPTFATLERMIQDAAYFKWIEAGYPANNPTDFWLAAEQELFGGQKVGGYQVYVCDLDCPQNAGTIRCFETVVVVPNGYMLARSSLCVDRPMDTE